MKAPTHRIISPSVAQAAMQIVEQKVRDLHPDTLDGLSAGVAQALSVARQRLVFSISHEQLLFILNTFLASFHDAHLEVRYQPTTPGERDGIDLPLSWLAEGLVVVESTSQLVRGERILQLGSLDELTLLERLRSMIAAENEHRLKYIGARRVRRGDFLRELGCLQEGSVAVLVESVTGEQRRVLLPLGNHSTEGPGKDWLGYQLYSSESLAVFWFERFRYNREMVDRLSDFFREVHRNNIRKVAVDLRGRLGGDSAVAFAFLHFYTRINFQSFSVRQRVSAELIDLRPQFSPQAMSRLMVQVGMPEIALEVVDYEIPARVMKSIMDARRAVYFPQAVEDVVPRELYLLTDAGTYSSGNLFALLVKDNALGQLVGSPTGNQVNFNGNELRFDIPGTRYYLNIPTGKLYRPDPGLGSEMALMPDVQIETTAQDIAQLRDPQLEYLKSR